MSMQELAPAESFGLPPEGVDYVRSVRANATKIVRATPSISSVRYPSKKNGYVIQCASRTVEFPSAIQLEFDQYVKEYGEQPPKLKIRYLSKTGRFVCHHTTPDMAYYHTEHGWVIRESKHRELIQSESCKFPNRYILNESGNWISPPGIEAAKKLGMSYELFIPSEEDEIFFRNCQWLEDFFFEDYLPDYHADRISKILNIVESCNGRVKLSDLISQDADTESIYRGIAIGDLHFDLYNELICRPLSSHIYTNKDMAVAWQHIARRKPVTSIGVPLFENSVLAWEAEEWKISRCKPNAYALTSETGEYREISKEQIQHLINIGEIRHLGKDVAQEEILSKLRKASPQDLSEANYKASIVDRVIKGDKSVYTEVSDRTCRDWKYKFCQAEVRYGSGYVGLIPRHGDKGNRCDRLSEIEKELIDISLSEDFLSREEMSIRQAYALYTAKISEQGRSFIKYETYRDRALSLGHIIKVKTRKGKKAAYKRSPPLGKSNIPTHGDRPWEIAHLDHTQLDINTRSAITSAELPKPWLTLLLDANSRIPLARYITYSKPSKISVLMVMRDCVYRHNRLPQSIVMDQGPEFNSIFTETLLAAAYVSKKSRPSSEPRFGSVNERMNGTITTSLLHALDGNNKPLQDPRSLSKSHDPRSNSVWTPDEITKLLDKYLFGVYPNLPHHELNEHPQECYDRGMRLAGTRPFRYIPYDEKFIIMTMPDPVGKLTRQIHHYGIRLNNLRYWDDCLKDFIENKQDYLVKFDPHNPNKAYIYLNNTWEELTCRSPIIQEYNESEIDNAFIELMARASLTNREYRSMPEIYAKFLLETKRNEEFLRSTQHLRVRDISPENEANENSEAPHEIDAGDDFFFSEEI